MCPMDFEEFLWAFGEDRLWEVIRKSFTTRAPLSEALHQLASDALRRYLIIRAVKPVPSGGDIRRRSLCKNIGVIVVSSQS